MAQAHVEARIVPSPPAMQVELVRPVVPPPPPPPPPPEKPAPKVGGGAPAAPSVVHVPPKPRPAPPEIVAPVRPAPKQELTVGIAPTASPTPGMGLGGTGRGTGTGNGDGDGPGSGTVPPRLITGPNPRQIADMASPAARRARIDGTVTLRCEILLDTRLTDCRVLNETPEGYDFAPAAIRTAETYFRFSPPIRNGRPVAGTSLNIGIRFQLGGRRPPSGPLVG